MGQSEISARFCPAFAPFLPRHFLQLHVFIACIDSKKQSKRNYCLCFCCFIVLRKLIYVIIIIIIMLHSDSISNNVFSRLFLFDYLHFTSTLTLFLLQSPPLKWCISAHYEKGMKIKRDEREANPVKGDIEQLSAPFEI